MSHSLSSQKRMRQNEERRLRNRSRKAAIKTEVRKLQDAIHDGKIAQAEESFRKVTKKLDQAASTPTLHKNAASRRKSRLAKKLNAAKLKAQSQPAG